MKVEKWERPRHDFRSQGADCDACPFKQQNPVLCERALGSRKERLVIVGESPGQSEDFVGRPFVGATGKALDAELHAVGHQRETTHITNAIACFPTKDATSAQMKKAADCCKPRLLKELKDLPKYPPLLAMGKWAIYSLTEKPTKDLVSNWIGYPLLSPALKREVFPMAHPTFALIYDPAQADTWRQHLEWATTKPRTLSPPAGTTCIEPTSQATTLLEQLVQSGEGAQPPSSSGQLVSLDIETLGVDPLSDKISAIGVSNGTITVSVPWDEYYTNDFGVQPGLDSYPDGPAIKRALREILATAPLVAHNGIHDILALEHRGLTIAAGRSAGYEDTLLAHAVAFQGLPHDLGYVAASTFYAPRWKSIFKHHRREAFTTAHPEDLRKYNAEDCFYTAKLWPYLKQELIEAYPEALNIYEETKQSQRVAMNMKARGWATDPAVREKHRVAYEAKAENAARTFVDLYTRYVGEKATTPKPSSDKDVAAIYAALEAPVVKRSEKTGKPSYSSEALDLYRKSGSPAVVEVTKALQNYRDQQHILNHFIYKLPTDSQDIIHATFNVHGAGTGRWSCKDPNLQQIPKAKYRNGVMVHPGLRDMFVARPGNLIIRADWSNLELRILAAVAQAKTMLQWFAEGKNVHDMNCERWFGEKYSPTQRKIAKNLIFGVSYGAGEEKAWKTLRAEIPGLTLKMTKYIVKQLRETHPEIFTFQEECVAHAKEHGWIATPISGRRKIIHKWDSKTTPNECKNYPIQGTAADLANAALGRVSAHLDQNSRIMALAAVHDEFILEGPTKDLSRAVKILKSCMEHPTKIGDETYSFPVEVSYGPSWAEQADWTDE